MKSSLHAKRVLLTGVSGFFGAHMLEHLLEQTDWEIVGIASWQHKGSPERVEEVLEGKDKSRVTIITHDLNAPFTERTKQRIGKINYIINAASDSHVDRSITDPVPFIQNNVNITLNMLEFARGIYGEYSDGSRAPLEMFIQFSTDEVYGAAPKGVNHAEWSTILPSNPYSASKAAQEAIAISYWRTYGIPVVITNTMNMFGEMQDPEKYTAQLISKIHAGKEVTVHGSEGNIGSRYYLHARNCADAILYLMLTHTPAVFSDGVDRPSRFNVVGDVEVDNLTLAEMVANLLGKPLIFKFEDFHKTRPGHDRRYALDGVKLKEAGWTAPLDFEESLQKYIQWTLKHPLWL